MRWLLLLLIVPGAAAQSIEVTSHSDHLDYGVWTQWQTWQVTLPCVDVEGEAWETRIHGLFHSPKAMRWTVGSDRERQPFVVPAQWDLRYNDRLQCPEQADLVTKLPAQMIANDDVAPGNYTVPIWAHLGSTYAPDLVPGEPIAHHSAHVVVPAWAWGNVFSIRAPATYHTQPDVAMYARVVSNAAETVWAVVEHVAFPGCAHGGILNGTATTESPRTPVCSGDRIEIRLPWGHFQDQCPIEELEAQLWSDVGGGEQLLGAQRFFVEHFLHEPLSGESDQEDDAPPERRVPWSLSFLVATLALAGWARRR